MSSLENQVALLSQCIRILKMHRKSALISNTESLFPMYHCCLSNKSVQFPCHFSSTRRASPALLIRCFSQEHISLQIFKLSLSYSFHFSIRKTTTKDIHKSLGNICYLPKPGTQSADREVLKCSVIVTLLLQLNLPLQHFCSWKVQLPLGSS